MKLNVRTIEYQRVERQLSVVGLADLVGVTRYTMSKAIKTGNVSPMLAGKICKALNLKPEEVVILDQ